MSQKFKDLKILVIGAGWFGCHIARKLAKNNVSVEMIEKNNSIFSSQSGFNSNRLHKGFHYPRANITRKQCIKGSKEFKKEYNQLCKKIDKNIIAIHKNSLIPFKKYLGILNKDKIRYNLIDNFLNLKNTRGLIQCNEELICPEKSKKFFINEFKKNKININYNKEAKNYTCKKNKVYINDKAYDWVIDCSGFTFKKINQAKVRFEPRITLLYESKIKNFALMLMDGPFWSIYPQKNNIYTLGSVKYSRLSREVESFEKANKIISQLNNMKLIKIKRNFEIQVDKDFSDFLKIFKYKGYYTSVATVFNSVNDERPLKIYKDKKMISVLGGKIDTVIQAGNMIKKMVL